MELSKSNGDNLAQTRHEMRNPVVDPRKSRRHGTDFGLGRYAESSLTELKPNPSEPISISAPLSIMQDNTAIDADSVSSLFECSALDFPQPPLIGSPVIRRMRSSPWFSDKDCVSEEFSNRVSRRPSRPASVLLDSDFPGPCYSISSFVTTTRREVLPSGLHAPVDETTAAERAQLYLSPYLDLRINDISLEMAGEALVGLDMNASNLSSQKHFPDNPTYGSAPSCDLSQASDSGHQSSRLDWSLSSDLLRWSTSHRSPPPTVAPMSQQPERVTGTLRNDNYGGYTFRANTKPVFSLPSEHEIRSPGRLPHIIRKVASMRSDSRPDDTSCILPGSTGPRMIHKSRSFRSIPLVACEAGDNAYSTITTVDRGPHQHRGWSLANLDYLSSSKHAQDRTLNDSVRTFEHGKGHGGQQMSTSMSLPSSGLGDLGFEAAQHMKVTSFPMALSGPFVHRETCNKLLAKRENDLTNRTDKSFIDITPNQGLTMATKRARVKNLIARASNGIIRWGRELTRKKCT